MIVFFKFSDRETVQSDMWIFTVNIGTLRWDLFLKCGYSVIGGRVRKAY